jgi:hypothetical protein
MRLKVTDIAAAFGLRARAAGQADFAQGVAHGSIAVTIARGVNVALGKAADIRPAAEETAEMAFLVAPRGDFDGTLHARV